MSLVNAVLVSFGIIVSYFLFFFFVGTRIKNNSIVDMGWGAGFVIPTVILYFFTAGTDPQFLVMFFVSFWGIRLTYYLIKRNWGKPEDFRYKLWRRQWKDKAVINAFVRVYLLQALIMMIVGLPVFIFMTSSSNEISFNLWSLLAIGLYFLGLAFEAIGDSQLKEHRKSGANGVISTGLWAFTRHPNYFGNSALWFGITLFIIIHQPSLWWTLISPVVMTMILYFISTPMLERRMQKKPGWEEYAARARKFIPWFPKENV